MTRLLVLLLALGCGAAQEPTVERGGETARGDATHSIEVRIDALLERLVDIVERKDAAAYAELVDLEGRAAIAHLVLEHGRALLDGSTRGGAPERLAFLTGAVFGAHLEPQLAQPVNALGVHLLAASTHDDPERREWLFPHAEADQPAPTGPAAPDMVEAGLRRQLEGSLVGLAEAGIGRCTRSTWIQAFPIERVMFHDGWSQSARRIWVARLDCMQEVGLFLFTERSDGSVRLLGFRFLTEEAHRDALAILESLGAQIAPEPDTRRELDRESRDFETED